MTTNHHQAQHIQFGHLASVYCAKQLPLQVLQSRAGFYIGTLDEEGPCSRESQEYFCSRKAAEHALATGLWTQKAHP